MIAKFTSLSGAKAETIRDRGEVTECSFFSSSRQLVAMDKESLPTGIHISHLGQRSMPTASTAS